MRHLLFYALAACATGIAACASPTAPHAAGITVLGGANQSDTINATLPEQVVIAVHAPRGASSAFQPIEFVGLSPRPGVTSNAFVQGPHSQAPSSVEFDTTNTAGQVVLHVTLGFVAGPARLVVSVPALNLMDTVTFTVLPGNAWSLAVNPDTVVYLGANFQVPAVDEDSWGNPRPHDNISLTVLSGPIALSGHTATPTAYGRALVVASSHVATGQSVDTLTITVVPHGTIMAGLKFGAIAMFNLDGSDFRVLSDITTTTVRWSPSGTQAVFTESAGGVSPPPIAGPIAVVDTATNVRVLDSLPSGSTDANPIYSRDGTSIYFNRVASPDTIWRMHADGTGIAPVPVNTAGNYFWPTPSPDGSQLAVVDRNSAILEVVNLTNGGVTNLSVTAQAPQWSPGSDLIAYIATASGPGPIAVIHADGTGQRVVVNGAFSPYFDWSPDGNWFVAWDAAGQRLAVIGEASGLVLPLDYASAAFSPTILPNMSPTWQPTSESGASGRFRGVRLPSKPSPAPHR
jgi:hypothetical protein